MESIEISYTILTPILLMILSGVLFRKTGIMDEHSIRQLNAAAFKFFLPVMMFNNIYESSFSILQWDLIGFVAAAVTFAFALGFFLVPLLEKEKSRRGVLIQGMVRSNFAVYGYAVASHFCSGDDLGLSALVAAVVLPLFGIYSTIALSLYDEGEKRLSIKKIAVNIAKNPLVLGGVFGVLILLSGIRFPSALESAMSTVGKAATPVSLIALGGFLSMGIFSGRKSSIAVGVIAKLIVVPLIFVTAAVLFGFRGPSLAVCLAIFASPTATASFAMTQQMSGDDSLAAALIVISCVCSFGTMFTFIFVLHGLGLF